MKLLNPEKNIVIVSGPAGSGKDSLITLAIKNHAYKKVISTTTRVKREDEEEGEEYYFLSKKDFEKKIAGGEFIEYSQNENGAYYGVQKKHFQDAIEHGQKMIWKVDWKGMLHARVLFPHIKSICIMASSESLNKRIRCREGNSYTESYFQERALYAKDYFNHTEEYDYVIWNEDGKFEASVKQFIHILKKITSA